MPTPCRGATCQDVVDWATWADGTHRHPINHPDPCPGPGDRCTHEGNLAVWWAGGMRWRSRVAGDELGAREHRATSHYATCPDASSFRCPKCGHKPHPTGTCKKLGRVTCRPLPGGGSVRGQFPCGCREDVTDADTATPAD